jgi:hypothetical protein
MKAKLFSKALIYHLQWKVQLKKFVDGQGNFNIRELSPDECKFGKWLCSDEAVECASEKELREICRVHGRVHATARKVYDQKMLGNDATARKELTKLDQSSMKLASLMTTLKALNNN